MGLVVFSREEAEHELREHRAWLLVNRGIGKNLHIDTLPDLITASTDEELLAAARAAREAFLAEGQDIPALPGTVVALGPMFHVVVDRKLVAESLMAVDTLTASRDDGEGDGAGYVSDCTDVQPVALPVGNDFEVEFMSDAIVPGRNESLFSLALEARCEMALLSIQIIAGDTDGRACNRHYDRACQFARRAGYLYAGEPLPHLLRDDDDLEQAWKDGVWDRQNGRRTAAELSRKLDIERLIAKKDWPALGLPFPEKILADLKGGKTVEVNGHKLIPYGMDVGIDNPYGLVAGYFGALDELEVPAIESFLTDMARDRTLGPVPPGCEAVREEADIH